MYYVYILQLSDGDIYKGSTANIKQRIVQHQQGQVTSTKHKRPIRLIHYEAYLMKSDATRRERYLKTTEGKRFLKQQIRDYLQLKQ